MSQYEKLKSYTNENFYFGDGNRTLCKPTVVAFSRQHAIDLISQVLHVRFSLQTFRRKWTVGPPVYREPGVWCYIIENAEQNYVRLI